MYICVLTRKAPPRHRPYGQAFVDDGYQQIKAFWQQSTSHPELYNPEQ
jgi:hypothetical protein